MTARRHTAKTPRGFVRLRRVNYDPGNLGFTIPVGMNELLERAGQHEGGLYRPTLIVDGIAFIKVPDHSPPEEREAPA